MSGLPLKREWLDETWKSRLFFMALRRLFVFTHRTGNEIDDWDLLAWRFWAIMNDGVLAEIAHSTH